MYFKMAGLFLYIFFLSKVEMLHVLLYFTEQLQKVIKICISESHDKMYITLRGCWK